MAPAGEILLEAEEADEVAGDRDGDELKADGKEDLEGRPLITQVHPITHQQQEYPQSQRLRHRVGTAQNIRQPHHADGGNQHQQSTG
jgi:hypothetical protein